jgi:hypothetical protein
VHRQVKAVLIFFNHQGIVHYKFTPEGQTIKISIWQF